MLEVFDKIQGKGYKEQFSKLLAECKRKPALAILLKGYIVDEDRITEMRTIFNMMRYYKVEKSRSINKICEIGEFAAIRMGWLRIKEAKKSPQPTIGSMQKLNMENPQFLVDVYKKLKRDVTFAAQYKILKNSFMLMKPVDIKWFTRIICRKLKITKAMTEVIKNVEIQNNL